MHVLERGGEKERRVKRFAKWIKAQYSVVTQCLGCSEEKGAKANAQVAKIPAP